MGETPEPEPGDGPEDDVLWQRPDPPSIHGQCDRCGWRGRVYPGRYGGYRCAVCFIAMPDLSVEQVEREPDPARQLRRGAAIIRRLNERSWLVADILRGAHATDERLTQVWAVWQQWHADAIRRAVAALQARGGLRPGLALEDAVDIFYALTGTDVYRALVRERGWSSARYQQWLFRIGCRELLGASADESPPAASAGHSRVAGSEAK